MWRMSRLSSLQAAATGAAARLTPLRVAVYSPLETSVIPPDVVLVRGNPRQLMLLAEAAQAAGVAGAGPTMGRPTCAVVSEASNADRTASSFGCIGNRISTEAPDDEAYFAIPGAQVRAIEDAALLRGAMRVVCV